MRLSITFFSQNCLVSRVISAHDLLKDFGLYRAGTILIKSSDVIFRPMENEYSMQQYVSQKAVLFVFVLLILVFYRCLKKPNL